VWTAGQGDLQLALRELVFFRRSGERSNDKQPTYNMDDIRFWTSDEFNGIVASQTYTQMKVN
jgi:hypothetical protein